jgi:hypothetical protein
MNCGPAFIRDADPVHISAPNDRNDAVQKLSSQPQEQLLGPREKPPFRRWPNFSRAQPEGAENSLMRFVVYVPSGASPPSRELRPYGAVSDSAGVGQRG